MSMWFDGTSGIECEFSDMTAALDDPGALFVGVVSRMPGMTTVGFVDQGNDSVSIETNDGSMQRMSFSREIEDQRVVLEFDEEYEAESRVTVASHFRHEFTAPVQGVDHRLVISNVSATGVLRFFLRDLWQVQHRKRIPGSIQGPARRKPGLDPGGRTRQSRVDCASRAVELALDRSCPGSSSCPEVIEPLVHGHHFGRLDGMSVDRMDQQVGQAAHTPEGRQEVPDGISIASTDPLCVLLDPVGPPAFSVPPKEVSQISGGVNELLE